MIFRHTAYWCWEKKKDNTYSTSQMFEHTNSFIVMNVSKLLTATVCPLMIQYDSMRMSEISPICPVAWILSSLFHHHFFIVRPCCRDFCLFKYGPTYQRSESLLAGRSHRLVASAEVPQHWHQGLPTHSSRSLCVALGPKCVWFLNAEQKWWV